MRFGSVLVVLAFAACACSGGPGGTTGQSSGGGTTGRHTSGGTGSGGTGGGGGTLESACSTRAPCEAGLTCVNQLPGGYCSAACAPGQACSGAAAGGVCIEALPNQYACALACTQDSDCGRAGYYCDPACQVCVPGAALGQVTCQFGDGGGPGNGGHLADGGACGSLPDGGPLAWSASVNASASGASFAEQEPSVAVDPKSGRVVVAYMTTLADGGATNQLGLSESADGGFVPSALVDSQNALAFDPTVAVDATGNFYLAYAGYGGSGPAVYLASSIDGGAWSTPAALPPVVFSGYGNASGYDKPFVAVNPLSQQPWTAVAAFNGQYGGSGPYDIDLIAGADGGSTVELDYGSYPGSREALKDLPALAFNQSGDGYAVWAETTDANQAEQDQVLGTVVSGSTQTTLWSTQVVPFNGQPQQPVVNSQVSPSGESVVFDPPRIAASPDGSKIYVVYVAGDQNATDIRLSVSTSQTALWSAPVTVNDDPGCATHFHPAVALDAAGDVWVTWLSNRDGPGRVYYAVSTDSGQSFSPSAVLSDQPFYFTTLLGIPAWVGGYQSLLATSALGTNTLYSVWSGAVGGTSVNSPAHVYYQSAGVQ